MEFYSEFTHKDIARTAAVEYTAAVERTAAVNRTAAVELTADPQVLADASHMSFPAFHLCPDSSYDTTHIPTPLP
jgi:hypothetical protein